MRRPGRANFRQGPPTSLLPPSSPLRKNHGALDQDNRLPTTPSTAAPSSNLPTPLASPAGGQQHSLSEDSLLHAHLHEGDASAERAVVQNAWRDDRDSSAWLSGLGPTTLLPLQPLDFGEPPPSLSSMLWSALPPACCQNLLALSSPVPVRLADSIRLGWGRTDMMMHSRPFAPRPLGTVRPTQAVAVEASLLRRSRCGVQEARQVARVLSSGALNATALWQAASIVRALGGEAAAWGALAQTATTSARELQVVRAAVTRSATEADNFSEAMAATLISTACRIWLWDRHGREDMSLLLGGSGASASLSLLQRALKKFGKHGAQSMHSLCPVVFECSTSAIAENCMAEQRPGNRSVLKLRSASEMSPWGVTRCMYVGDLAPEDDCRATAVPQAVKSVLPESTADRPLALAGGPPLRRHLRDD